MSASGVLACFLHKNQFKLLERDEFKKILLEGQVSFSYFFECWIVVLSWARIFILLRSQGIDSNESIPRNRFHQPKCPELEFLKSLWGLGTKEEEGYRTGPSGYIGWRNSFLGIDPGAPYTFKNTGSAGPIRQLYLSYLGIDSWAL